MLRDIVNQWMSDGLDVEVMSSQPSYKRSEPKGKAPARGQVDGVQVRRIALPREHGRRWLVPVNIVAFSALVAVRILTTRRKFDVVMTSTAPPVVLAWAASRAARLRGGKFVYHCMDIHPEIGRVSGEFSHPLVFRTLQWLDRMTCETAAAVVVLSRDMAESLRRRDTSRPIALHVINNFELGRATQSPVTPARIVSDGRIHVVFAGNVGRFQGLETVIEALGKVQRARVHLTLMGDGVAVDDLKKQAAVMDGIDVDFVPHQDVASARALIASADLGLVSLTSGIHRFAYPSKTMTYLAEGCPVLAVVETGCELVERLEHEGLGFGVPPGSAELLAQALDRLNDKPGLLTEMRSRARANGASLFDKDTTLLRWSRLVEAVVTQVEAA